MFPRVLQRLPMRLDAAGGVIVGAILLRLLAVDTGFGADSDAWRVADSGFWFAHTGDYVISRRPGYPIAEMLLAALSLLERAIAGPGWWTVNVATAAVFGAQLVVLRQWANRVAVASPAILLTVYALHPTAFDHSVGSVDIHLSVLLSLLALRSADAGHVTRAGLFLGMAIGTRMTAAVAFIPCALLIVRSRHVLGHFVRLAVVSCIVAIACYLPVLAVRSVAILPPPFHLTSYLQAWVWMGLYRFLGALAVIGLAAALWSGRTGLIRDIGRPGDPACRAIAAMAFLSAAVFLVRPYDTAYLIPSLPFLLLLLGRVASHRVWIVSAACIVVSGFLAFPALRPDGTGRVNIAPVGRGEWWTLWHQRQMQRHMPEVLASRLASRTMLLASDCLPTLWFHHREAIRRNGEWRSVSPHIENFNTALYNQTVDAYVVASWDSAVVASLRNGYTVRIVPALRHLN